MSNARGNVLCSKQQYVHCSFLKGRAVNDVVALEESVDLDFIIEKGFPSQEDFCFHLSIKGHF